MKWLKSLNLWMMAALVALLLLTPVLTFAQDSQPVVFATVTGSSEVASPPDSSPADSATPVSVSESDLSLFATLISSVLERTQGASTAERNFTLGVLGVIVVFFGSWLYKSTPPGPIKDKIGGELLSASAATVERLKTYADLTPTDIDNKFLNALADILAERLQLVISKTPEPSATDTTRINGLTSVG